MKDIVIIANFCRDFSANDNGRFMYLCRALAQQHHVELITSDFYHATKTHRPALNVQYPFKITFLHEPGYQKNISMQRLLSHRNWGKEVGKYLLQRKQPDVIYCAVPSLTGAQETARYCKTHGVRFIIDIQDLWPEAFLMKLRAPFLGKFLFAPLSHQANQIYKQADVICAVSQTYVNRALRVNQKCKTGHAVFLGTHLSQFDQYAATAQVPLQKQTRDKLWLGYCGSLSASYDIPCVLEALYILKNQGNSIPKFIVIGDGAYRKQFESLAKAKNLDIVFLGKLPYGQMCAQLKQCDIVVNPITKGSAASIINKHGDYAAAGIPVLNTQQSPEYRALVENYRMGFNCNNADPADLAAKLKLLIDNPVLRQEMGKNARKCAEEKFDRKISYQALIQCILGANE